jgi:hypothetical protein
MERDFTDEMFESRYEPQERSMDEDFLEDGPELEEDLDLDEDFDDSVDEAQEWHDFDPDC